MVAPSRAAFWWPYQGFSQSEQRRRGIAECAKSKELADRVKADILEVRQELLELEKLGIVYRTGQTRGTRWWLG